jgi:hypothetical protein
MSALQAFFLLIKHGVKYNPLWGFSIEELVIDCKLRADTRSRHSLSSQLLKTG